MLPSSALFTVDSFPLIQHSTQWYSSIIWHLVECRASECRGANFFVCCSFWRDFFCRRLVTRSQKSEGEKKRFWDVSVPGRGIDSNFRKVRLPTFFRLGLNFYRFCGATPFRQRDISSTRHFIYQLLGLLHDARATNTPNKLVSGDSNSNHNVRAFVVGKKTW